MSSCLRKCARRAEALEFIPEGEKYLILKEGERHSRVAVRNLFKKKDPDLVLEIRDTRVIFIKWETSWLLFMQHEFLSSTVYRRRYNLHRNFDIFPSN